jgi:hypothetical protein
LINVEDAHRRTLYRLELFLSRLSVLVAALLESQSQYCSQNLLIDGGIIEIHRLLFFVTQLACNNHYRIVIHLLDN